MARFTINAVLLGARAGIPTIVALRADGRFVFPTAVSEPVNEVSRALAELEAVANVHGFGSSHVGRWDQGIGWRIDLSVLQLCDPCLLRTRRPDDPRRGTAIDPSPIRDSVVDLDVPSAPGTADRAVSVVRGD